MKVFAHRSQAAQLLLCPSPGHRGQAGAEQGGDVGYQFSPRLADIRGNKMWHVDGKADYGALDKLAAQHINVKLIVRHWKDLLCLAGSLELGTVQAADLIQTLKTKYRPT